MPWQKEPFRRFKIRAVDSETTECPDCHGFLVKRVAGLWCPLCAAWITPRKEVVFDDAGVQVLQTVVRAVRPKP